MEGYSFESRRYTAPPTSSSNSFGRLNRRAWTHDEEEKGAALTAGAGLSLANNLKRHAKPSTKI